MIWFFFLEKWSARLAAPEVEATEKHFSTTYIHLEWNIWWLWTLPNDPKIFGHFLKKLITTKEKKSFTQTPRKLYMRLNRMWSSWIFLRAKINRPVVKYRACNHNPDRLFGNRFKYFTCRWLRALFAVWNILLYWVMLMKTNPRGNNSKNIFSPAEPLVQPLNKIIILFHCMFKTIQCPEKPHFFHLYQFKDQ